MRHSSRRATGLRWGSFNHLRQLIDDLLHALYSEKVCVSEKKYKQKSKEIERVIAERQSCDMHITVCNTYFR